MKRFLAIAAAAVVAWSLVPAGATALATEATSPPPRTVTIPASEPLTASDADPGALGPYPTRTLTVFGGWESVDVGLPLPAEDLAEVTLPIRAVGTLALFDGPGETAEGEFPVVLLLHGRHVVCSDVGGPVPESSPAWCPNPYIPVPSYTGYRYLAERLASQGRIVISISANAISALDNETADLGADARARLIEHHLASLERANLGSTQGYGDALVGHVDLSRTVLMGHSRGGEGVVRAAQVLAEPVEPVTATAPATPAVTIAGVIPLASVSYLGLAPPVVPTVALLPACDGDQEELPGQMYQDRGRDLYGDTGALRSSVWIPGGNHDYFNTEWTPGLSVSDTGEDDSEFIYAQATGSCEASQRLTPAEQRAVGLQYVAAAVRYAQDAETRWLSLLDGSGAQVPAVQRLGQIVRATSLAGPDRLLLVPSASTVVSAQSLTAEQCRGDSVETPPHPTEDCGTGVAQTGQDTAWIAPRWVNDASLPGRTAIEFAWPRQGSVLARLDNAVDLSEADRLSTRVILDPASNGTVGLAVQDAQGNVATLPTAGLAVTPLTTGETELRLWPQTAWVDPSQFRGVDLTSIVAVGVSTQGQGRGWLLDVSGRTGSPSPAASVLPAASVEGATATIAPGSTANVPVTVSLARVSDKPAQLVIQVGTSLDPTVIRGLTEPVTIPAGSQAVTVQVPVTMPPGADASAAASVPVAIYPTSGATLDRQRDVVSVAPSGVQLPQVSLPEAGASAPPGSSLTWEFVSDIPGNVTVAMRLQSVGMNYADLDADFLQQNGLPTSGPIPANAELTLVTTQVGPDRYRATLPLSDTAQSGAWLSFLFESIQGGQADEIYSMGGGVE